MFKHCIQGLLVSAMVANLLWELWKDIYGQREKKPLGFKGVILTLLIHPLMIAAWWYAGGMSTWFQ